MIIFYQNKYLTLNMTATLYLITTLIRLFDKCSEEERENINRMVSLLNHLQVKYDNGTTFLHEACSIIFSDNNYDGSEGYSDPDTVRLLIQCGADVNAMDYCRNTPYHMIPGEHGFCASYMALGIIEDLAEAGAHIYCLKNQKGTSVNLEHPGAAEMFQMQANLSVTTLKCIAAIAVKSHELDYQGQVPQALESFIELHGPIRLKTP